MKQLALVAMMALFSAVGSARTVSSFSLPNMNAAAGSTFNSKDFPGGVFVVEAFFLGCPYCNENADNVNKLSDDYKTKSNVQVLDVGIDRNDSQYQEWINRHKPNHPVLKDANRVVIKQLGTSGYPSTYVLDCRGNVVYQTSGPWETKTQTALRAAIDGLLAKECIQ